MSFFGALQFCYEQHGQGLVIWDSEEKFKDVLFIVGKSGVDKSGFTALTNPDSVSCQSLLAPCSNQLVNSFEKSIV